MLRTIALSIILAGISPAAAQSDNEVESRLTPALHLCETAPQNGGTLQQAECYRDEDVRQDRRLNETWKGALARLLPYQRDKLRRDERIWIKKRRDICRDEESEYVNSTAAYMFEVCMANAAIRRTIWLERIR